MQSQFTSEFFEGNRKRLRELFTGTAPIVLSANGLMQRRADSTFAFAQDANFWYLTGLDEPDLVLVMERDKEYLIVPERTTSRQTFDGLVEAEALTRRSGIATVYQETDGWQRLGNRAKKVKHVATLAAPASYVDQYGIYTNPARSRTITKLKSYNNDLQLLDLTPHVSRMRMVKQPAEVATIRAAVDITVQALKAALSKAKRRQYSAEYELEAELTHGFRRRGAHGHAFEPIVAAGPRACTLHYVANDTALSADELIVIDVGAEVDHYAADITRTISLGSPTRRQLAVHAAVLEAQQHAIGLLKPGIKLRDYEHSIELFLGEKLRELGLLKTISHEEVRRFCPHATTHFLGLTVHDIGDYERPLEPGMVVTVEPGIYIPGEAIGVRIEDDILITERGNENLSKKLSHELS